MPTPLRIALACLITGLPSAVFAGEPAPADGGEWVSLFDGKTLDGWDGNPKFWSVEDGAITGRTTPDNPTKGNTFLIWDGELADFELTLEYKIVDGNSGIQYRSYPKDRDNWVMAGYQADIDSKDTYSGILYSEKERGILAKRGEKTEIGENHKPKVVGSVGDGKDLQKHVKKEDWNTYRIVADGFHFTHQINGVTMVEVQDNDKEKRRASGLLALQLHAGPPMTVQFRNIKVKHLSEQAAKKKTAAKAERKRVLFIAGTRSHGYGSHEHKAGCMLLAKHVQKAMPNFDCVVIPQGWPKTPNALEGFDAIVMYCDGGGRHMVNDHVAEVQKLVDEGTGILCIHYGVEVPKGEVGDAMLKWTGGYFETWWSVNPHWTAVFKKLPEHPITNGVEPFSINDEWYYHMRFPEEMRNVTPILTAIPPESTLKRPDGAHSGNEHVRKKQGLPQHVAWAIERPDGGRGFGFTGGHYHWNWGHDDFRRVVLNAVVWTAGGDVPEAGVPVGEVNVEDLMQNQDYDPPKNFDPEKIQRQLSEWND